MAILEQSGIHSAKGWVEGQISRDLCLVQRFFVLGCSTRATELAKAFCFLL